ncbi:uncharacterized protein LOC131148277 [Malania oleifera]|uniref:uncharacterized protein LOC131148277 n=1 Tax=Malania oleifera TaxID=397392 RepID=UPI0025ADF7DB|nr:uncharacterized protein LOC131148277 [Malania oleifera]
MDLIKYVFEKPAVTGQVTRWHMLLTEYDITYVTRKAIKGSVIAEYMVDRAVEDYQPMEFDFPDKDINSISQEGDQIGWTMLFDEVVNVWGHGIEAVLISPKDKHFPVIAKLTFPCTNNIAEFEACIMVLFKVEPGVEIEPICIRVQSAPAYCAVMEEIDGKPWSYDIKTFIQKKEYS